MRFHVSIAEALRMLEKSEDDFALVFEHGSMTGVLFGPAEIDGQEPHLQDEIYIVVSGSGTFELEEKVVQIGVGDFLFVPAGAAHRFRQFSPDLLLWVILYGQDGGERE